MMEQIGNIQEVVSSLDMLAVFSSLPIYIYIYIYLFWGQEPMLRCFV